MGRENNLKVQTGFKDNTFLMGIRDENRHVRDMSYPEFARKNHGPPAGRILLVDDEVAVTFGYSRVLDGPRVTVDVAHSTETAFRLVEEHAYSGAVVDLRLSASSDLEGLGIVRYLKSRQPTCKVVVLTAYCDVETRLKAEKARTDVFLKKPVEPELVVMVLLSIAAL